MFNNGAANNNSAGKRKMNQDEANQTANQFNHFNLNGSGHHLFASSSSHPPPPTANQLDLFNRRRFFGSPSHPPPPTANQFNPFNLQGGTGPQLFASSSNHPPSPQPTLSQVNHILNNAAPTASPFSFMSLITAPVNDDEDADPLVTEMRSQTDQVNHILSLQTDLLKQALKGMLERQHKSIQRAAEENANKKLKQLEAELRMKSAHADHYRREADRLLLNINYLGMENRSLKYRLDHANEARRYEDGDSSTEDTEAVVGPVKFDCKICGKQLATVLMWPCRHVCVCKQCDAVTDRCPVCRVEKRSTVDVFLKLKQDD
ncbi:hypothetical protein CASFOL_003046 [Castilleja foliolosa]|uniref:RING-type domain-containing protein n=1 Tax=Castilleja foliolosa TaxID=1961234 RepID=A0ABD3EJQ8_9LAMI